MSTLWILATVLQWAVIIALAVITLSLVRQFGIVAIRLNPSTGMETSEGPGPGTELVAQQVSLLSGGTALFGGQRERPLVTVFLSPDCSICNTVARHVGTVARDYRDDLDLLVVIHATPRVAREYARDHSFDEVPVAIKQNFPSNHGISTTPFALALTTDGTVAARGVPNALEHLEEMVAQARGYDPAEDGAYAAELGPVVDDAPSRNDLNVLYPSAAIAAKGEEA